MGIHDERTEPWSAHLCFRFSHYKTIPVPFSRRDPAKCRGQNAQDQVIGSDPWGLWNNHQQAIMNSITQCVTFHSRKTYKWLWRSSPSQVSNYNRTSFSGTSYVIATSKRTRFSMNCRWVILSLMNNYDSNHL